MTGKIRGLLALGALLLAVPVPAHGATIVVDPSDHTPDYPTCGSELNPCGTIQAGIDSAAPGDTVSVGAGWYYESLVVNKPVTLLGARAGEDARGREGSPETEIFERRTSIAALDVQAPDVVIDGFSIKPAPIHSGVRLAPEAARADVANNRFTFTQGGEGVLLQGADDAWVYRNDFGSGGDWGVRAIEPAVERTTLEQNAFRLATVREAVYFHPFADASDLQILDNTSVDTFAIYRATGLTLTGNKVSGADRDGAFRLTSVRNALIADNVLEGNTVGIGFFDTTDGPPSESAVVVGNTIVGNTFGLGMFRGSPRWPAYDGTMEVHFNRVTDNEYPLWNTVPDPEWPHLPAEFGAEDNWWGCNAGLDSPDCGFVEGAAYTEPHLVLRMSAAPQAVPRGGTAALAADLTQNSDGDTLPGDLLPSIPGSFAASAGSVSPAHALLEAGAAAASFTAPADDRVVSASATVDHQTAGTDVTVGAGDVPKDPGPAKSSKPPVRAALGMRVSSKRPSRSGKVSVRLGCADAGHQCTGRVELRLKGRGTLLGKSRFEIPAGAQRIVRIRLTSRARTLLRRRGRLTVVARTKGAHSGGEPLAARVAFTLKI